MNQSFKNKDLCSVRTITTFISLSPDRDSWKEEIVKAVTLCSGLSRDFQEQGYVVQTNRIVTNPFGEYLNTESLENARDGLRYLSDLLSSSDLSGIRIRFAIGEARTKAEIALVPELIQAFGDLCNVCVNVGLDEAGILDNELIQCTAKAVKKIGEITP